MRAVRARRFGGAGAAGSAARRPARTSTRPRAHTHQPTRNPCPHNLPRPTSSTTQAPATMSEGREHKTPNDPVKEQIAQDKFGKSYDDLDPHQRIQVGGTKGGIVTKEGEYGGHYKGEGTRTDVEHTGDAVTGGGEAE